MPKHKTAPNFNGLGKIFLTMSLNRTYFLKLVRNLLSFTPSIAQRIIVKRHIKILAY